MQIELYQILRNIPFLRVFMSFVCGILIQFYFFPYKIPVELISVSVFVLYFLTTRIQRYQIKQRLFALYFMSLMFAYGAWCGYIPTPNFNELTELSRSNKVIGIVYQSPKLGEKSVKTRLKIVEYQHDSLGLRCSDLLVMTYFEKDSNSIQLKMGDEIVLQTKFEEIVNQGNPYEFDFKGYMNDRGVFLQAYISADEYVVIKHQPDYNLQTIASGWRDRMLDVYKEHGLEGENYAVAAALTLGYVDEIDADTRRLYASTGATHILSVSGLHVGVIYVVINFLLQFMDRKLYLRILKGIFIILFLWMFALISGLSPSVQRSAFMLSIVVVGNMISRNSNIINTLLLSAFVLLVINPYNIKDVGFQLSYVALLSILIIYPIIEKLYTPKNYILQKIWSLAAVSLAAQLGTSPLSLYYFHQFPNYFLLTNIVVVPLSSMVLYFGILSYIFFPIEIICGFFVNLLKYNIKIMNYLLSLIESLPFSVTSNIYFNLYMCIFSFVMIISFILFFYTLQKKILLFTLIGLSIYLGMNIAKQMIEPEKSKFVVYNIRNSYIYGFYSPSGNIVICDTMMEGNQSKISYYIQNQLIQDKIHDYSVQFYSRERKVEFPLKQDGAVVMMKNYLEFEGKNILFLNNKYQMYGGVGEKFPIDFVIVSNNANGFIEDIIEKYEIKQVIVDGSNKKNIKNYWIKECEKFRIKCYAVADSGAFVKEF